MRLRQRWRKLSTTCRPFRRRRRRWDSHLDWLLHRPVPPAIPQVKNAAWVANPIDAFVLQKLEAKDMSPAPPASKRALLRRVYFDLIGVPPTPEEVHAFENKTAPMHMRRSSIGCWPIAGYGERWARHWLDLARFAESDGFAIDGERPTAWRYRDYVIRSIQPGQAVRPVRQGATGRRRNSGARAADRRDRLVALGFLRWEPGRRTPTSRRKCGRMF